MSYILRGHHKSVLSTGFADRLTRLDANSLKLYAGKERPQEYEPGKLIFPIPKVKKAYWTSSFLVLLQDTCLKGMSRLRCSFPNLCSLCSHRQCTPNDRGHLSCDGCRARLCAYVSVVQPYKNLLGSILMVKCC